MADKASKAGRPDHQGLFSLASTQAGYFTAAQAGTYGFSSERLHYHAKTGAFRRIQRGLYRLRDYPSTKDEEVVAAWVKVGHPEAFISHVSALSWHEISDLIPNEIEISVPRAARHISSSHGIRIHTLTRLVEPGDVRTERGVLVSSPARAIVEAATAHVMPDQIEQAVFDALDRGLVMKAQLLNAAAKASNRVSNQISRAIERYDSRQ